LLDGLRAAQLYDAAVAVQQGQDGQVPRFARAGAGLAQQPDGVLQLRQAGGRGGVQALSALRRRHQHEFVVQPGARCQGGVVAMAFDQTDVEREVGHACANVAGVADGDARRPVGCVARAGAQKLCEKLGQHVVADGAAGADAQRLKLLPGIARHVLDLARALQQGEGAWQQRAPVVVQQQSPAGAVKQLQREHAFELVDGCAGGRLRKRHRFAGGGGAAGLCDGDKNLQLAEAEAKHVHRG